MICYLTHKQLKNYFLSLKKNPAKLTGYVCITLLLIFIIFISIVNKPDDARNIRNLAELGHIIVGFFVFIFGASIYTGLERGATFFKISDVNLLFTAPISSKKVLLYGLLKQMGTNLMISIFLLYQMPNLIRIYNITWGDGFIIFCGYIVLLVSAQLCSMVLYMFTNGNPKRKKTIKNLLNGILLIIVGLFIYYISQGAPFGSMMGKTLEFAVFIPFAGWIKGAIYGILAHEAAVAWIYVGLTVMGLFAIVLLILTSHADYYEDVLTATEYMEEVTQATKKGRVSLDTGSKLKGEKIKRFGLKKGQGASAIFYKQIVENKRSGYYGINMLTLIQMVAAIGAAYFLGKNEKMGSSNIFLMLLGIATYMQVIYSSIARWATELQFHYIYLIPQSGLKKMIYASLGSILNAGIDGAFIFIPAGILLGINPLLILLGILTRISFEMLFIGISALLQRIFGILGNKGIMMLLYIMIAILFVLPGVIGGIIAAVIIASPLGIAYAQMIALSISIVWNVLVALVISFFANQIFSQMELNTKA